MQITIGIDPGASGGIAWHTPASGWDCAKMPETERDVADVLEQIRSESVDVMAYIEAVHSMPKQGVASSFTFGRSYGFLRGLLIALKIPFTEVTPQKWQKELECRTAGDKNVSKRRAQQLFPGLKITHATADALLICEYGRRKGAA